MTRNMALAAVVICNWMLLLPATFGQESNQDKDNIGHRHHMHRHNNPHPRSTDKSRFTTSRQSQVELPLPEEKDAFSFIVFGDRTGGPADGVSILADAVRDVNLLEPDLVMTVGDLIDGYNQTPEWMEQMREFKGIMDQLICPWFPVAGNHDIYWRGPAGKRKPEGEHEANYEMHFGPLWYAFEHKNCWFIVLYSDEGNPKTGKKAINDPASQVMSEEQFAWLKEMLGKSKDANHVFVFLHHPRWLRSRYGDDWDKVHKELVAAGNVSAVFAGHIHRARYDPEDGIEYISLATTGGHQSGRYPAVGFLHHFDIVTVRKQQIALASVPVGEVQDVREVTGKMQEECIALVERATEMKGLVRIGQDGQSNGQIQTTVKNTASKPIEVTVSPKSPDNRWIVVPDHVHRTIEPGENYEFRFEAKRLPKSLDTHFRPLTLGVQFDYLAKGFRYSLPEKKYAVPYKADLKAPPVPEKESVLRLDGRDDHLPISSEVAQLPDGPMTVECWFKAKKFNPRTGLICKTESSEYGIFISDGRPEFSIFLGGRYVTARDRELVLDAGRWYHIAGEYDEKYVRLYVDGKKVAELEGNGARRTNNFPLVVGADVDYAGRPTSFFNGDIDEVRLSKVARYGGNEFEPSRRLESDANSVAVFRMDGLVGPWLFDYSPNGKHIEPKNGASIHQISGGE